MHVVAKWPHALRILIGLKWIHVGCVLVLFVTLCCFNLFMKATIIYSSHTAPFHGQSQQMANGFNKHVTSN